MAGQSAKLDAVELATELTIAWLSNPNTRAQANEVPEFLRAMHIAVSSLIEDDGDLPEATNHEKASEPAVSVRKSLASEDHILSLIDGKPYKSLKRHLAKYGLTPADYRQRYGLKADYPMVAPAYAEKRRTLAKNIGLGRKPRQSAEKAPARTRSRSRKQAEEN